MTITEDIVAKLAAHVSEGRLAKQRFLQHLAFMGIAASVGLAALSHSPATAEPVPSAPPPITDPLQEPLAWEFVLIIRV